MQYLDAHPWESAQSSWLEHPYLVVVLSLGPSLASVDLTANPRCQQLVVEPSTFSSRQCVSMQSQSLQCQSPGCQQRSTWCLCFGWVFHPSCWQASTRNSKSSSFLTSQPLATAHAAGYGMSLASYWSPRAARPLRKFEVRRQIEYVCAPESGPLTSNSWSSCSLKI
jgi:hypothetical protein